MTAAAAHGTDPTWIAGAVIGTTLGLAASQVITEGGVPTDATGVLALAIAELAAIALTIATGMAILGAAVYLAPARRGRRGRRLCYLQTRRARATMVLQPDPRRGALPGDVRASSAAAWPKRQGAGTDLGLWVVVDQVHAQSGRLTLTARPALAKVYRRHGFIDDGRTAWVLPRLASRHRPYAGSRTRR